MTFASPFPTIWWSRRATCGRRARRSVSARSTSRSAAICGRPRQPGEQIVLVGAVNTVRGTYDFQGRRFDILRDGTVRFDGEPLNDLNPMLDMRTQRHHSGRRGARQRPRHAERAGDRPQQHAAARAGRHPGADRLQPADQLARRGPADLAGAARAAAGDRRSGRALSQSIGNALGLDTFEINTAPDSGSRRVADRRPAARPEPVRQGASRASAGRARRISSSNTS